MSMHNEVHYFSLMFILIVLGTNWQSAVSWKKQTIQNQPSPLQAKGHSCNSVSLKITQPPPFPRWKIAVNLFLVFYESIENLQKRFSFLANTF